MNIVQFENVRSHSARERSRRRGATHLGDGVTSHARGRLERSGQGGAKPIENGALRIYDNRGG
jgi:hypothetical protein